MKIRKYIEINVEKYLCEKIKEYIKNENYQKNVQCLKNV